jgi:hypothetical protein
MDQLMKRFSKETQKAIIEARQKGASSWVTARLEQHNTVLNKGDFRDAICIRYGWQVPFLPHTCCCGAHFDLQHALDCGIGGYRTLQHREAGFAGVEIEPRLQPLTGESLHLKSANQEDEAEVM